MQTPAPPSSPPKKLTTHLLKKLLEEGTEHLYKEDCPECGEENSFIKNPDYLFEIAEEDITQIIPTWVCSECGYEALEDDGMEILLNLLEHKKGNHHIKIEVKNGKPINTTIH